MKIGFLIFRVIRRTREKDVFIEASKSPREKTTLPLKHADRRFHSAARPQNGTAEWVPRKAGEHRRFYSAATDRRSRPQNGPDKNRTHSAVSFGGFGTADQTAVSTREIKKCQVWTAVSFGGWKPPIKTAEKLQKPLVIFGGFIPRPGRRTRPPFHQNWWNQGRSQGHSPTAIIAQK